KRFADFLICAGTSACSSPPTSVLPIEKRIEEPAESTEIAAGPVFVCDGKKVKTSSAAYVLSESAAQRALIALEPSLDCSVRETSCWIWDAIGKVAGAVAATPL